MKFSDKLENINGKSFYKCNLTEIEWGKGIRQIYSNAFFSARIDTVTIPPVEQYYLDNFQYCSKIIIPETVKLITGDIDQRVEQKIFIYCVGMHSTGKLKIYYFGTQEIKGGGVPKAEIFTTPKYEGSTFFKYTVSKTIDYGFRYYTSATGGYGIAEIFSDKAMEFEIPRIFTEKGSDAIVDEIGAELFKDWNELTEIVIPNSIKTINESAFSGCSMLYSIKFEDTPSITEIMSNAFSGTALESFTFPDSITKIGSEVFSSCNLITSVSFPSCIESCDANALQAALQIVLH